MDSTARKLLIEQTRKELIDELLKYKVGLMHNGWMTPTKTTTLEDGVIFVVPVEIYKEWST